MRVIDIEQLHAIGFDSTLLNCLEGGDYDSCHTPYEQYFPIFFRCNEYYDVNRGVVVNDAYTADILEVIHTSSISFNGNQGLIIKNYGVISYVYTRTGVVHIWTPTFESLFDAFLQDNVSNQTHVNIMCGISDKIKKNGSDAVIHPMIKRVIKTEVASDDEWICCRDFEIYSPYTLYSILKYIMVVEDEKYSKPHEKGHILLIEAFQELVDTSIDRDAWRKKYKLKDYDSFPRYKEPESYMENIVD